MLTRLVAIALVAIGVCACGTLSQSGAGAGTGSQITASPASTGVATRLGSASPFPLRSVSALPSPAPTISGSGTLTNPGNGAVIRLSIGQSVTVVLSPHILSWHVPSASGAALRRTDVSGGYPGRTPARATFVAVQAGRAFLSSIDDTACLHRQPACMLPQQSWHATVIVS